MKNKMIQAVNDNIAQIERAMVANREALDGCQWLIEIDLPGLPDENGPSCYPAILGEWPKSQASRELVRGFRSSALARNDLCGCILSSCEKAGEKVDALRALKVKNPRMVPRHVFLQKRLNKARELLASLE